MDFLSSLKYVIIGRQMTENIDENVAYEVDYNLAIVLPLMPLKFGVHFQTMYTVQHLLPPSRKNSKVTSLQMPLSSCHPCVLFGVT